MLFRKITCPKITDAPGQHVGLRGAGAAACTELSVHTPGGDRRQGRTCGEPTIFELRMVNPSNSFEEPEAEIHCLLLKT